MTQYILEITDTFHTILNIKSKGFFCAYLKWFVSYYVHIFFIFLLLQKRQTIKLFFIIIISWYTSKTPLCVCNMAE